MSVNVAAVCLSVCSVPIAMPAAFRCFAKRLVSPCGETRPPRLVEAIAGYLSDVCCQFERVPWAPSEAERKRQEGAMRRAWRAFVLAADALLETVSD